MRFELIPWGARAPEGAAACDGLVPGAAIDLSHWSGNRTPASLKADTSVEIALAFGAAQAEHSIEVAANNHFDADGVLAVWTLLRPELAAAHREVIVAAAEHGDFDVWPGDDRGIWLESAISALAGDGGDRAAYAAVLPALDALVPGIERREDLWGAPYRALLAAGAAVEQGAIAVERAGRVAVIRHARGAEELPGAWISRLAPPDTDRWLIAFEVGAGFRYRYELPRHAWADTVRRPPIPMPRRGPIRRALGPSWIIKGRRGMTGISYTDQPVPTRPEDVARVLAHLDPRS